MTDLDLGPKGARPREYVLDIWRHRQILMVLARTSFHARYKRASLGVAWAVVIPIVQAVLLVVVFSRLIRVPKTLNFGIYIMSGLVPWTYFVGALTGGATAIVDASQMTDKVWFPRALLPVLPAVVNLVSFGLSLGALLVATPVLGAPIRPRLALVVPAAALLVLFTIALTLVVAALHVYIRDVQYIVQTAVLLGFYATPVLYPISLVGGLRPWLELNPMTGIVTLFRLATVGADGWQRPVTVSVVVTVALLVGALEIYRRHDRLFADRL